MSVCRLSVFLFVCFGLTVISVNGGVPLDDVVVFPESLSSRYQHSSRVYDNEPVVSKRTIRQGNRRQRPPMINEGDPFAGLDPQTNNQGSNNNNNRPFGGNQGQWSNQRPNQQQGSGNRPSSNQWGGNGNNLGLNQWGTNGNNQGQNQWGTNGNNQGQNQLGANGNNQGQNQLGTSGNNQGQNQWGTNGNNQGQNQWGTNGNNQGQNTQGNRPPTTQSQPTNNQNPVATSTPASNSGEANEAQRNTCNMSCKERITNEYNPVCGSDSQTYQNRRFLECVANCGILTEFSYIGTCVTTTERTARA